MLNEKLNIEKFLDEITDLVQSVAPDGSFLYTNRAWRETLGYTPREIKKLNMFDIVHPDSREHCVEMFRRVMGGDRLEHIQAKFIAKSGSTVFVDGNSNCTFKRRKPYATRSIFRDITERRRAETALRASEAMFQEFMNNSPVVAFMKDDQGRYVYANRRLEAMFNIKVNDLIGKNDSEWLPEEVAESISKKDRRVLSLWQKSELVEMVPTPDGASKYWMVYKFPFEHLDGRKFVGGAAVDITERREAEEKLRQSEQHYRFLVEGGHGFICTHDLKGNLRSVNMAAQSSLGYAVSEMVGKNLRQFIVPRKQAEFDAFLKYICENATASGLMTIQAKDGSERVWKFNSVKLTESVEEPIILGHAQDVSEMREMQKQFENQSLTDDLTGLYNRRGFLMLAERRLRVIRAEGKQAGVFMIFADMDGLKQINDTYGHEQGSLAIKRMSELLAGSLRGSDVIARLGGDEFVVLVVDERDETQEIVARRLEEKIKRYNEQKNHPFDLSLSVGVTPVDLQVQISIEELLRRADERMYEQKRRKKLQLSTS